ncbi:hypothetical protein [Pedobacter sp.]|uniref:hypothetical protein n=1 Tax=Pedobacter sp. TaxID=1411316 RepID=UPI003BABADC9
MKSKTVFILGAGFSKEANAPSQEELVKKIFEIHKLDVNVFSEEKINKFKDVLKHTYNLSEELQESMPLEDIFTPLDKCLVDNISFRNLNSTDIKIFRGLVYELIGKALQHLLENSDKDYINIFANYLVEKASVRKENKFSDQDPVSVLSTNWDILLDNSIHQKIAARKVDAVVDYCCYISSYDKSDKTIKPGLEVLGRGGFNVKLLKLHGSLNWLQCPRCQRLYVKFYNKIAINPYSNISKPTCRHCDNNFGNQVSAHNLISNLIMPTFLKDLSNPQYKIIWQNAGIELSEANKLVFIGYSLPPSDFEMRQLLSRMVRENAKIEVVDYRNNEDSTNFNSVIARYRQFFGRDIKSYENGAKHYIENEIAVSE